MLGRVRLAVLVVVLGGPGSAATALAQDRPLTTVLRTTVSDEALGGLGGAVERLARTRLGDLGVVETAGTPGLSLSDLQLAVGCVGQTAGCMRAVAQQLEVQALLLSSVDRAGETLVLTLTFFDARDGSSTEATRRASSENAETALLDGVDGALREIFDLPPPDDAEEPKRSDDETTSGSSATGGASERGVSPPRASDRELQEPKSGHDISPVGIAIGAAGLVALAVGTGFAVKARNTEDQYADAEIATQADVDRALDLFDDADRQAKIANVMFGAGAALVAGGALLLFLLGRDDAGAAESSVAVTPVISPRAAGVTLAGRLGEAR